MKAEPITPASRAGSEAFLRRDIAPVLGKTKLGQITPERVRRWHAELTARADAERATKSSRRVRAIPTTATSGLSIAGKPCVIEGAGTERAAERPRAGRGDARPPGPGDRAAAAGSLARESCSTSNATMSTCFTGP